MLFRLPPGLGASSGSEGQLLGQAEWEAAFERAVLDGAPFLELVRGGIASAA